MVGRNSEFPAGRHRFLLKNLQNSPVTEFFMVLCQIERRMKNICEFTLKLFRKQFSLIP